MRIVLLLLATGCLTAQPPAAQGCSDCHGSASSPAPPTALGGATDPTDRGVGAHQAHLAGSAISAPVACEECHQVPGSVDAPGHVDTPYPAEVTWANGTIAKDGAEPWDAEAQTCVVYCHGATLTGGPGASPQWTEPGALSCTGCHGNPPPAPHPSGASCGDCHPDAVGGLDPAHHVDGVLDCNPGLCDAGNTGETGVPGSCAASCHGTESNAAPPPDPEGNTDPSLPTVGAHEAHALGTATTAPVACGTCHTVPSAVGDAGHLDDSASDDVFSGVAALDGHSPAWNAAGATCSDTYCHGQPGAANPTPVWTQVDGSQVTCAGCHAMPPLAPHPQRDDCESCHTDAGPGHTIVDPARHVDGVVDLDTSCTACHGSGTNPAPPPDLDGNSDTTLPSVGAHDAHVLGTATTAPVACGDCHTVPAAVGDAGHLDDAGTDDVLSGVADNANHHPTWNAGAATCSDTYCHNQPGATHATPTWTQVDGTQVRCISCHGMPPPAPHEQGDTACEDCHPDAGPNHTIVDPSKHVDGVETL